MLALVLFVVLAQVGPGSPIVEPPKPPPVNVTNIVNVQAPPPDPQAIADASTQSFQAIVVQLIAPTLVGWANDLLDVADIFRTTPPDLTYNNAGVRALADQVRLVAFALIGLAIFGVGAAYALGQQPAWGRLLYAVVLSAGDLVWWQWGIDLNNAINGGIAAPEVKAIVKPHLTLPTLTTNPVEVFGPAVLVIVYAIVALLLLLSLAFRLGLLDILIAIGPLALVCSATEQSQGLFQTYARLAVGTLFSQVLIVVCLKLAPIVGGLGAGVVGTLLGIVILLLARRMPSLLSSAGAQGGSRLLPLLLIRRLVLRH